MTNYNLLVEKTDKIASFANDMQNYILDAYFKIGGMVNLWNKKYYNYYVGLCNALIGVFNNVFSRAVSFIPDELYARERAYANADQVNISSTYNVNTVILLKAIPTSNADNIDDLNREELLNYKNEIENQFCKAKNVANEIVMETENVNWEDIDATKTVSNLVDMCEKLEKIVQYLSEGLDIQMHLFVTEVSSVVNE